MNAEERPTFESAETEQIYRYVERHGTAKRHKLLDVVSLSAEEFRDALDRLTAKGYIEEENGNFRVALNVGAIEEHEAEDGTAYAIRPARQQDFEGLVETIRSVTDEETYVVAESVAEELLYEDTVTRHNPVESRVFFVAAIDDTLVGWTHLDLPQLDQLRHTAQQTVGVDPDHRRHGIGSALLERGLDWAEANGYRKVYNSVPVINEPAIRFLEDHGWNTEAMRKDHYTIGEKTVDELMMARKL
jgi:ribosomal protein S18 acetylase RimI-like enzyme